MAKSSISADVKAANSKLAQFLRRQEEEEMLLQIGKTKPKQEREEKRMPAGRARWSAQPDFKVPTCMVDRPRTADGATSFHFSYMSISKEAVPTIKGQPLDGVFGRKKQPALDHAKYIERDGAAEVSEGAKHADYIERPDAIEAVDPSALVREAIERQLTAVYNETPTEEEASILGVQDVAPEGIPSVFSNISDDAFERQEYWRAIERTEREPKSHRLFFDPEVSPRWWAAVERAEGLDPAFKEHLLTVAEQYRQYQETPTSNDEAKEPFKCAAYPPPDSKDRLTAERAGKLIEQAIALPGFDYSQPPIEFKSGRGGRVQIRMVAELPHEISAEDRALIVQNFCDRLGSLETRIDPDGTERQVGMMYTAVIHAPDAHNDDRNYHLHIVAHDRPARFLDEHGQWDFEYEEHYEHKSEHRIRYPLRQHKVGEIARAGNGADYSRAGRNFVPAMRRDFAKITNTVLKARGIKRQYDPRRYTEMGIDRTPTEHLGTKAAALEAIGVPTTVGQLNAIAIWNDAERNIERQAKQAERGFIADQKRIETIVRETASKDSSHPALPELRKLLVERERLTTSLAEDRRAIMAFDNMEAKAKSRAVRTRQTCLAYLGEIEKGVADGTTRVMKFSIEARFKDAQEHINKIDAALAPHRDTLLEAARDVERREARVAQIDRMIEPIASDLRDQLGIDAEKKAANDTVVTEAPAPLASPVAPEKEPAKGRKKKTKKGAAEESAKSEPKEHSEPTPSVVAEPDIGAEADNEKDSTPANAGPMTMEGLPITEGTIQPPKKDETAQNKPAEPAPTPEGLEPLRPEVAEPKTPVEPEVVIPDLDREDAKLDASDASRDKAGKPAPAEPDQVAEAQPDIAPVEPSQEKVDRRRKEEDPTLFELPKQEAPVKPGTKKAEHADWDALMNRIVKDRIPIKMETTRSGKAKYTVPALGEEDQDTLKIRRFAYRTTVRLESIYDRQQQEIRRLARWIKEQGHDPEKLILENRIAKVGDVRPAVRTLMRNWGRHPDILDAVRAEHNRRVEASKVAAQKLEQAAPAPTAQPTTGKDIEALRKAAAEKYPEPDTIHTKAVADFARLLREVAPEAKLREAADKIYAGAKSRDDVHRYGSNLAVAYDKYVEGVQLREAMRHRNDKGGRG
ncbi:MobA/MobL family protein [Erythrobacter aureus]|uniref:MobA/MobL protein domain-containing protein n=1 Tax=Erythrobacter aureus TaxID=2182384 RepID=A0A345YIN6_9SPHN|nr:MobA/MobL family protein [Erythrobacter aureus]AXK43788.1 hypothetical protein DVR09_15135 [Erythrobacter aureus]